MGNNMQHPDLPSTVATAICAVLGADTIFSPLAGGTNQRTYLAQREQQYWVVRAEAEPALSLQRAILAQQLAHKHGVRVPTTIAHDQTPTDTGPYLWSVETFAAGAAFDDTLTSGPEAKRATQDLGQQLRRLHAIEVDAFGDCPPRPYPVYPSAEAWLMNKRRRVASAVALVGGDLAMTHEIEHIYTLLASAYTGRPYLAKGDCAGANLLVDNTQQVTLIDWEWAQGLDPAADLAYWCHFTPHSTLHETLLNAYEPTDLPALRQRVLAYRIVHSIELIHVYEDHTDAFDREQRMGGFRREALALQELIKHYAIL